MQDVTKGQATLAVVKAGLLEMSFKNDAERLKTGERGILERDELIRLYEGLGAIFAEMGWVLATALDGDLK